MTGENYVPRPNGRFVSFADQPGGPPTAPYTWPQDTLNVPNGFGDLPLINDLNANRSLREFWACSTQFLNVLNAGATQTLQTTIPLDKDGDFWCSNIAGQAIYPNAATVQQQVTTGVPGFLEIVDLVNGYNLTSDYTDDTGTSIAGAPWAAFEVRPTLAGASPVTPSWIYPSGAGTCTDMIQPYCFLRGGVIRVRLTVPALPVSAFNPLNYYLRFAGWKEYAYAAV